jgi:hypothetical protein
LSRPALIRLDLVFGLKGPGRPGLAEVNLSFAVSSPDPTIYAWDRGAWQPSAQRAWTAAGWFPPVT